MKQFHSSAHHAPELRVEIYITIGAEHSFSFLEKNANLRNRVSEESVMKIEKWLYFSLFL
jgi:hypothetical protein